MEKWNRRKKASSSMSENVSSNFLFHFTGSMDGLKAFSRMVFSLATVPSTPLRLMIGGGVKTAHPMASTYGVLLRLAALVIRKHSKRTATLHGLDKKWGLENRVAPDLHHTQKHRPASLYCV